MNRSRLSFQELIFLLFIITIIPLLVTVGLVVFRLQQTYLVGETQKRLVASVGSSVKNYVNSADLTILAENLGEQMRAMGADMFVFDVDSNLVTPFLGTGLWLDTKDYQTLRETKESSLQVIGSDLSSRMVYLAAIVDQDNNLLGSVETSLSMKPIIEQLKALNRWLVLIIIFASVVSVGMAFFLSNRITNPLTNLVKSVNRVRSGDFEARAPDAKIEELENLASAYNQMLDRVSDDFQAKERLVEAMSQFVGDASHELRSPLAVFRNSVDLLNKAIEQRDENLIDKILVQLHKEVDGMSDLVDNLLLLARFDQPVDAAEFRLNLQEVDPLPLLEEVFERYRLLPGGELIEMVWPSNQINPVLGDRELLRRALINVIENAIIYSTTGEKIILALEVDDEVCCFCVQDHGIGISKQEVEKVFDRFYRSDRSRNRKIPGTGLGLSITAVIVKAHGGRITIGSETNQGTLVKLCFPVISSEH